MLEGSPWSRVKLMVARAYPWAPSSPHKKAEKKKRARQEEEQPAQVNMSEFEVELVRGPDLNAEVARMNLWRRMVHRCGAGDSSQVGV